jgi:hypothetical protein
MLAMDVMSSQLIACWTQHQLLGWRSEKLSEADVALAQLRISRNNPSIFIFDFHRGGVEMRPKPSNAAFLERATLYLDLFRMVQNHYALDFSLSIAVDTADCSPEQAESPIWTFQKEVGQKTILLPDIEFLAHGFYENGFTDPFAYDEKNSIASFAGSTTGAGTITMEMAKKGGFPRLEAARFFQNHSSVEFRLSRLVQCATPEVEQFLRSEGYGSGMTSWEQSFRNKFLISIDGNGAACSRPFVILKSNSVLLKYDSKHVLFYSHSLVPWLHFVPISRNEDVLSVLDLDKSNPELFGEIAQQGRSFAERYLTREIMHAYVASLLKEYYSIVIRNR